MRRGVTTRLGLVMAIALTRGLHEDGLADTADGLGVHGTRERRLAAMKDSAVGAHGALAMTTPGDTTMATFDEVQRVMKGSGARVQR